MTLHRTAARGVHTIWRLEHEAVIMCHVRCVYEPVAVEVGEERLGLACVRVTVEQIIVFKKWPRPLSAAFHPPLATADRTPPAQKL